MKIIITEEQYKKIFLSGKYDNLITEQLTRLIAATERFGTKLIGLETTNLAKLKRTFNLADNITLRTISDLMTALEGTGVSKFRPAQFKALMSVSDLKTPLLDILSSETQIKNLLTLRSTAQNLSPTHPKIVEIDNFLGKFLPKEEVDEFVEQYYKDPITPSGMKTGDSRFKTSDVKNIFGELKTQSEVLEWMEKNKKDLTELTNGGNYVNVFNEEQRKLWKNINDNLKEMLPIIKNMDDDVLKILKTNNINPLEFKQTLLKVLPSKPSQFFIKLLNSPFGKSWIGRKMIYGILVYMVWSYGPKVFTSVLDFVDFVTSRMSGDNKEENDADIKSKFETWFKKNSPEGGKIYSKNPESFTITIKDNVVSLLDPGGALGDMIGGQVYDYEYNETDGTFKYINDDETQSTGTFENSLEGFKKWLITPKSEGGAGKNLKSDEIPSGTEDIFTINVSGEIGPSYEFINGAFKYKKNN